MPRELIERIDAYRFGEPHSWISTIAGSDRKPGSITLLLSSETIEMLEAFRADRGLKTRAKTIVKLIEDGLRAKLS